jgi:cardiolipin synthase
MGSDYYAYAALMLILSGLSDMFDGFFARKLNQETELGKILDPIADKLTLAAVVICMWYVYHTSFPWISIALGIMLVKEISMAVGGLIIVSKGKKLVKAKWWGKVATVVFYTSMILIVALNILVDSKKLTIIVPALAFFAAAVMVFALIKYLMMALKIVHGEEVEGTIDFEKEKCLRSSKKEDKN